LENWDVTETGCGRLVGVFESGSAAWHEARGGHVVTGSTIGAILGVNPWESAVTRFYKASGQIPDSVTPNVSMRIGSLIEQPLLDLFAEQHPDWQVFKTGTWESKAEPRFKANPDAVFIDEQGEVGIVEVKFARDYWSAGVPLNYQMQLNWYLGVLGLRKGRFVALAGSTWTDLEFVFDEFLFEAQVEQATEFLKSLDSGVAPAWDGAANTYETARALNPEIVPDSEVELSVKGEELLGLLADQQSLEQEVNRSKSEVLAWMGDAKYGLVNGVRVFARQQRGGGVPFLTMVKGN
jgi:predicted phage-related endonuclease